MTSHIAPLRHWIAVHVRRHVAFTIYTAGTLSVMAWIVWNMIRI